MPPELVALAHKPLLLLVLVAVSALGGMVVERGLAGLRRRAYRRRPLAGGPDRRSLPASIASPSRDHRRRIGSSTDQLKIVLTSDFSVQPLLNRSEARVFRELDRLVQARNASWQVMAQVSLGEILRSGNAEAYACINAKRVDLLLVDADCRPRHAVEYQGHGHHQADAAARDAVKREALRRAGIGYHEVLAGHTTIADLKRLVSKLVEPAAEVVPAA